jgi:hypothetical protein
MDRLSVTMDAGKAQQVLEMFRHQDISYLVLGRPTDQGSLYDSTLHLAANGTWKWSGPAFENGKNAG